MSKKHHTILPERTLPFSLRKSITRSAGRDPPVFGGCTAISPDSQQIVTFCQETHEFKLYNIEDLSSSRRIFKLECGINDKRRCWSIAISNCVDGEDGRLIALSCFDVRKFRHDEMHSDHKNDLDFGDKVNSRYSDEEYGLKSGDEYRPQTWVISTKDGSEIYTSLESIGGVIRFLNNDDCDDSDQPLKSKNKTVIIIVNASGIFKEIIKKKKRKENRFFSLLAKFKRFELPQQLSTRLSSDHCHNSFELLHTSIIKNHFMVQSFKNRQQIIEMYSLITGDLEMLFKRHESLVAPNVIHGSPIFAISQNEKILAFCRGSPSITLYFMENGLEIATKHLECQRGIYKIADMNFIDADSKLLIVLEEIEYQKVEKEYQYQLVEILKRQIFVVWDLFTTFENSIRQIDYSETPKPLKIDATHRLMNSHGKVLAITDNGGIFSVLDHPDVASIRNPSAKAITEIDITTRDHVYHAIYNIVGERSATSKLEKNQIIINNVEPWHLNKSYFRISVYLDSTKSTQLIISSNTIQVWKYCNNNTIEKRDKRCDRVLEYIWARNKVIDVHELRIGEREFILKVSVSSTKCSTPKTKTIHWPNNVNVLEGACQALYVLGKKKHIVTGHENVNKIKYLIECTQRLARKYITKYGIFRLTSIRYPIMKYLIKSYQESLIKHILNKKINGKNSNIYIPRLYKWEDENNGRSTTEISKSDLHHAISCIEYREDSTVILRCLMDYYADNSKEYNNHGWMFTLSKAIPLLYDNNLNGFVQDLFKKPCFGITEAYTPPLHISPFDQTKGNNAAVIHSLSIKPRLVSNYHNTLWFFLKNLFKRWHYKFQASRNDRKVYMVPLPDFTVYPNPKDLDPKDEEDNNENYSKYFWFLFAFFRIFFWPRRQVINNTKKMSPFLRVIHEEKEKGYKIYQTPTIMAVLDFKWSAARRYFIRHIFILKFNIHNFPLGSVLLPLLDNISSILYDHQILIFPYSLFNPIRAFTALVMWLELLLLLRYFENPGRFIYIINSILNTIWPFFAFMLIAVIAFGHAMFILINQDNSSLRIPTYKIKDTSNLGLYSNITIYQDVDKSSRLDNYYSHFVSSVEAVFFWTNGRWDQLDQWDSFTVNAMSVLGSIILVLIFQNMLIAFMNDVFDKANNRSRIAVYRYHAELVAEYEALEKPFNKKDNPRYIYYIPDPDMIDTWLKETENEKKQKLRLMGENLADLVYSNDYDDVGDNSGDDDDDVDNQENLFYSKESRHTQNEGPSSTMASTINKISFIDEEVFSLKVATAKLNKKSQRNRKSNNKSLKNVSYNKSKNEPLSEDLGLTTNVDDQLPMQENINNLENEFKTRFNTIENEFKTRFDELDQNLKNMLKALNNLNIPK
ncbi:hypothetical protein Glove_139g125 [Diversispora epigaea]|uniref:Ion transport domain-containing protein n=1 Tax=Diversispora epigaea TaxID=1348612 RepID=A0A397J4I2_9GLOM|nr:hypothetical protein Glove_139g125 [Diversispora epigaea]